MKPKAVKKPDHKIPFCWGVLGLGQGMPILFCGWPAVASGQGDILRRVEIESGC
jgi:hypothetical protein